MASILTNNSAMVALQTLRGINSSLTQTQNEIATGKSIVSAKDNSAIWAISKVMEADVNGFKAISDSLALGESTIAVARQASEAVSDLLTEMKGKIVAAQENNVDRGKIQVDIDSMRDQINSIVNAAQFNGLNLVKGTEDSSILASLDRDSSGTITANNIAVTRQDLTATAGTYNDSGTTLTPNATVSNATLADTGNTAVVTFAGTGADYEGDSATISVNGVAVSFTGTTGDDEDAAADGIAGQINALGLEGIQASAAAGVLTITSTRAFEGVDVAVSGLTGDAAGTQITNINGGAVTVASGTIEERAENVTFSTSAAVNEGDGYRVGFAGETFTYIAGKNETFDDVAKGLKAAVDAAGIDGITTQVDTGASGESILKIDNDSTTSQTLTAIGNAEGTASGGLFGLDGIDVTTDAGAEAALSNIDTFIDSSIDAAASFGSVQGRIELQADFVGKLTDSLKSGIGTLVDADMEEASARLQALQVQQQLGIQSLSIANQAPQSILSLFR